MPCTTHDEDDARSISGSVAYVPQTSWIFNGTIRDNITFGLPYEPARFEHAVMLAGMTRDLTENLKQGDMTEVRPIFFILPNLY